MSLRRAGKSATGRSVLKRTERIKWMMEKGLWTDESKPFGLPKIKVVRLKAAKKEKKAEGTEEKPAEEKTEQTS